MSSSPSPNTKRLPGMSVRLKLTLSYAGFLMLAGALLLAVVWFFLLRYVPDRLLIGGQQNQFVDGVFPIRSNLWRIFAPRAAVALLALFVVGLAGGWWLAGRMLAPLTRITDATRIAGTGELTHRIELPGRQDEFRELADAFDGMLARLETHVEQQQRFAANASHELRTPLSTTQALLEVARKDPDRDVDVLLERLGEVNAGAIRLTEALLLLSRSERRSFVTESVDLSLIVEEAVETLLPMAERAGVSIQVSGAPTQATGSPTLLLQLVTNLVQNAVVHNLPANGTVSVVTASNKTRGLLMVENSGAEITADQAATFTEPFLRGAGRLRGHDIGVGLGLAIVDSIVRAHDGSLSIYPRSGGGLRVVVELPLA